MGWTPAYRLLRRAGFVDGGSHRGSAHQRAKSVYRARSPDGRPDDATRPLDSHVANAGEHSQRFTVHRSTHGPSFRRGSWFDDNGAERVTIRGNSKVKRSSE